MRTNTKQVKDMNGNTKFFLDEHMLESTGSLVIKEMGR